MFIHEDDDDILEHYGVKGMKWGVRRKRGANGRVEGVSRKENRAAKKDAKEFARAKQFYGEGAGNRRKLIKTSVESKKSKSSSYAKAFDEHLSRQDGEKHVNKAKAERRRKDAAKSTKQSAGAVARQLTGQWGTKAAFVAVAFTGARYLQSGQGKTMMNGVSAKVSNLKDSRQAKAGAAYLGDYFKRQGL